MIDDIPAIREQLCDHWQTIGLDLVKRGFNPEAVFETMLTVGLAGLVSVRGKEASAAQIAAIAATLSEQVRQEGEALREAAGQTRN